MSDRGGARLAIVAAAFLLLVGARGTRVHFVEQDSQASAGAAQSGPGLSLPGSDLARTLHGAQRLMEKAHTETYDVAAAAKLLGDDIDKSFAFVRDNFAFDPYAGCLRGVQGTLMARAGNDIDRSLLLAALLSESGHSVRLVQGTIGNADAARLLMRAKQPPVRAGIANVSMEDAAAVSGLPVANLRALMDKAKATGQQVRQDITARTQHDTDFIQQKLQAAGIRLSPPAGMSPDAVRHHVWVQVQVEENWKDLDSSFPDARVGQHFAEPEGESITTDALPDEWYQTLRLRVLSLAPGASDPDELLNQQLHVAAVVAQPLDLVFAPQDDDDPFKANTFQPTLVAAADRFTGDSIELGVSTTGGADAGGLFGGLAGAGGVEAGNEKGKALPKILLEITLEGPGAAPERITRLIVEPSTSQDATTRVGDMRDQLASIYQFVVSVGPLSPDWVAGQQVTFLQHLVSTDEKDRVIIPMDLLNLAVAASPGGSQGDQPRRYYARPLLLAQRVRFRHGPSGTPVFVKTIDILHNRVEFLGGDPLAAVRQGVLETELERATLPGTEVRNTTVVFERAQAAGIKVLGPRDAVGLGKIDLAAEAKARIADDLAAGYAVIVPSASVQIAGMPAVGWWRVRPLGGETLGRMQSGEGQSMTERILTQLPGTYSLVASTYCKRVGSTSGVFCNPCLIAAAGFLGAMIGIYNWAISDSWGAATIAYTVISGGIGFGTKVGGCSDWWSSLKSP